MQAQGRLKFVILGGSPCCASQLLVVLVVYFKELISILESSCWLFREAWGLAFVSAHL